MALHPASAHPVAEDKVSNILKWVLLAVAIATFALLGWTTVLTYEQAPPLPDQFVTPGGTVVLTEAEIYRGKQGFQRADLMDYGSLYGMGSYFGEDYTADILVKLATQTEENIARQEYGKALADLNAEHKTGVQSAMQTELQNVDLTKKQTVVPFALASAIATLRGAITDQLLHNNFAKGWTKAYSLDAQGARDTASFLIYSSLTTVARRPGSTASWTQNWPYEPLVGNTPTTSTFIWTWVSFCFTFFMFGAIIYIYQRYLNEHDNGP
ncbi:MAG: nitric oxide reductase, partial [Alphaproteobacteria bacterium]|nr:nitric oxide reductase [Alphaproteobacteria bacterium]